MTTDPNDLLLGAGLPSCKFPTFGTTVKGTVLHSEVAQQTDINGNKLTWDNGDPRTQVVITLQTDERDPSIEDDDGRRKLYCKPQMQKAIGDALRAVGAKLEVGGTLAVRYESDAPPKVKGHNGAKQFVAQYQPPAQQAANDLLGAGVAAGSAPAAPAGVPAEDLF